jgi:hypothetical protein
MRHRRSLRRCHYDILWSRGAGIILSPKDREPCVNEQSADVAVSILVMQFTVLFALQDLHHDPPGITNHEKMKCSESSIPDSWMTMVNLKISPAAGL